MICILYKNNAVIQFLSLLILHISFHKYGILLDPFNLPPWLLFQERLNPIFVRKKDLRGRTLEGLKILYLCGLSAITR